MRAITPEGITIGMSEDDARLLCREAGFDPDGEDYPRLIDGQFNWQFFLIDETMNNISVVRSCD